MTYIHIGIVLFALPHFLALLFPGVRNRLSARLGENAYKGLYSLSSLIGVIFMGFGYWQARHGELSGVSYYEPAAAARHITLTLVLIGFILMAANGTKSHIRKWLRHPFSIGAALWSIGHLLGNGEIYVVPIFAVFLAVSIVDIALGLARQGAHHFVPEFKRDCIAVVAGLIAYAVFALGFHPYVLGIPVLR